MASPAIVGAGNSKASQLTVDVVTPAVFLAAVTVVAFVKTISANVSGLEVAVVLNPIQLTNPRLVLIPGDSEAVLLVTLAKATAPRWTLLLRIPLANSRAVKLMVLAVVAVPVRVSVTVVALDNWKL